MKKSKALELVFKINNLSQEWDEIVDMQHGFLGTVTFKNPTDYELKRLVLIQEQIKYKKEMLRKEIGFWRYVHYSISPLSFVRSLIKN